jgi:hypothetical protein
MDAMNTNPLDRTRAKSYRAIEEANNSCAILVYADDGSVAVLPYSSLRGAMLNCGKLTLVLMWIRYLVLRPGSGVS